MLHSKMKPIHLMNHMPDEQAIHGELAPPWANRNIPNRSSHSKLAPTFISKPRVHGAILHAHRSFLVGTVNQKERKSLETRFLKSCLHYSTWAHGPQKLYLTCAPIRAHEQAG